MVLEVLMCGTLLGMFVVSYIYDLKNPIPDGTPKAWDTLKTKEVTRIKHAKAERKHSRNLVGV